MMNKLPLSIASLALMCSVAFAGPLHDAVKQGDTAAVSGLLDKDADPNERGRNGETPLTMAALSCQKEIVALLLEKGAVAGTGNAGGFSALHAAAYAGHADIVALLLEQGFDVNDASNNAGVTALVIAAEENHPDVASLLIEHGADVELKNKNGQTPLTRALWRQNGKVVTILQASGAECQPAELLSPPVYEICMAGVQKK